MVFYKKTGTLLSPLAARWCICCFQLAWWHPFSGSRCCPLLHWCNSGITPLTSVNWLQIYPRWKQNWTIVFLFACLLRCSQEGAPLPYHKGKASACLLCHAQLFCVLDITPPCLAGAEVNWCGACVVTRFPMLNGAVAGPRFLTAFPFRFLSASSCLDMFSKETEFFNLKKYNCKS